MKKILLLCVFVLGALTCSAQKAKSFYYDGIELHNVKGWQITPSKDDGKTTIIRLSFGVFYTMVITKRSAPQHMNAETVLTKVAESIVETNMRISGRKTPKIKDTSSVMEGFINNIPAKYIDINYTKGLLDRIYVMTVHNCLITVQHTGHSKATKVFDKILSTFTFNPETDTYRLF